MGKFLDVLILSFDFNMKLDIKANIFYYFISFIFIF